MYMYTHNNDISYTIILYDYIGLKEVSDLGQLMRSASTACYR